MNNIYDSHAHYESESFDEDREELISSLPSKGICCLVNCGSDIETSKASVELSEKYDFIYAAVGVHPHEAEKCQADYLSVLREMSKNNKVVAIGEIGLDYHYDLSPRGLQQTFFEDQIKLAIELDLPIIVHDREAHEDTMNLLKKYRPKGVVHCFSGSVEMAEEVLKLGMYIGLGGATTFKNARKPLEVAAMVPNDKLVIETDCPYMTPVPFRGKRNDSSLIPYSAQIIAEVRNTDTQSLLDLTKNNANILFGTTR